MNNLFLPLETNEFYHIYNRGNNKENLFYNQDNYHYFLKKYDFYMSDYLETYTYCLLPNHFHLLVRVRENIQPLKTGLKTYSETDKIVSEGFRRFFTAYAKAINKQENRTGSLFQKNFKRKKVHNQSYFTQLIYYIHNNPRKHHIFEDFTQYPHSSYGRTLMERPSKLCKKEVIEWFGSKEGFIKFHKQMHDEREIQDIIIEDDD